MALEQFKLATFAFGSVATDGLQSGLTFRPVREKRLSRRVRRWSSTDA